MDILICCFSKIQMFTNLQLGHSIKKRIYVQVHLQFRFERTSIRAEEKVKIASEIDNIANNTLHSNSSSPYN